MFASGAAGTAGVGNTLELTKTWGAVAAFEHYWTPSLRTSWVAGYLEVEYSDNAKQLLVNRGAAACAGNGITLTNVNQCANPDWSMWRLASRTMWNPVRNLDVGVEIAYTQVNTGFGGTAVLGANSGGSGLSGGPTNIQDNSYWSGAFRVQRSFWP